MSQGLVDLAGGKSDNVVDVGDKNFVDMKLFQSVYNQITGKSERLTQEFKESVEVHADDLDQLDSKIRQVCSQYAIKGGNASIVVYHIDDCKQEFSSYDRFKAYDRSISSPCENVRLHYNFLIVLPDIKKAQTYEVIIDLSSRVGINKKEFVDDLFGRSLKKVMMMSTGSYSIKYVDYVVARTFKVALDEWYKSLHRNDLNPVLRFLKANSDFIPFAFRFATMIVMLVVLLYNRDSLISLDSNHQQLFSGGLLAFGAISVGTMVAGKLGQICEQGIDALQPISGIRLNRGDEKAFKEYNKTNKTSIIRMIGAVIGTIAVNVISSLIAIALGLGS